MDQQLVDDGQVLKDVWVNAELVQKDMWVRAEVMLKDVKVCVAMEEKKQQADGDLDEGEVNLLGDVVLAVGQLQVGLWKDVEQELQETLGYDADSLATVGEGSLKEEQYLEQNEEQHD